MEYNDEMCGLLKKIREGKQIKVKKLVEGIMSPSYYYKIENGENRIAAEDLALLLDKMNINVNEFFHLINGEISKKIELFSNKSNIDLSQFVKNTDDFFYEHLLLLSEIRKESLSKEKKEHIQVQIKSFLFEKEMFLKYEIAIFNNFLPILDTEIVIILYKKIIKSAQGLTTQTYFKIEYIQLIENLTYYFLLHQDTQRTEYCFRELKVFISSNIETIPIKLIYLYRFYEIIIEHSGTEIFFELFNQLCKELKNNGLTDLNNIFDYEIHHFI